MIEAIDLCKSFDDIEALKNLSLSIKDEQVFGLVGTNGAGKSTLLRLAAGVLRPDSGEIRINDKKVWDDPEVKKDLFFIADDPYFFPNASAEDMRNYYSKIYENFDCDRFDKLLAEFGLDAKRAISKYSKGMKKQLSVISGISSGTKYLLCDETFDGLDPVMRQAVKSLFAKDMYERGLTPVIASHNLRELEDICEHVGLLHKGGLLLSEDLEDMKLGIQKLQCVFANEEDIRKTLSGLTIISEEQRGKLRTYVIRGERQEILDRFNNVDTVFFELLPLTLEEIFICETEVVGYDIKKIILG